jgi:NAD(P)-dependent dehydrogenase (short-subunit alcohol dehydrogenase family)
MQRVPAMEQPRHVAIVTGAGGTGSGRAIARRFANDGAAVVVADINESGGHETVRLIEASGGRAAFTRVDIRDEQQARELVAFGEQTFGAVTILVNNASAPFRPGEPLEHWEDAVQTDLLGAMFCTRAAIDAMRRAGSGAIVNIASISALWHGRTTPGGAPAFDAAKAGLIRLTTTLAGLAKTDRVRVNCLAPGWIDTDGPRQYWASLTPDERLARGVPSKLLPTEAIAEAVARLAIDDSLNGRIVVWWSEDAPKLVRWGDRGYAEYDVWSPP